MDKIWFPGFWRKLMEAQTLATDIVEDRPAGLPTEVFDGLHTFIDESSELGGIIGRYLIARGLLTVEEYMVSGYSDPTEW